MVKVTGTPLYRHSDKVKLPSDAVFAPDQKSGFRFPTDYKNEGGKFAASAGPFAFKADKKADSKFTWTPLSGSVDVGASFSLKVAASNAIVPFAVKIGWTPALPDREMRVLYGAGAGVAAMPAILTGLIGMGTQGDGSKTLVDMSAFLGLISAAFALIALQENISMKLVTSPILDATVHPLLVLKKTEGKEWEAGALKNKSQGFKWEKNETDLLVAVGLMEARAAENANNGGDAEAVGNQVKLSGNENEL